MLGVKSYPKAYVEACREKVDAQIAAYRAAPASPELEPLFFNHMVLALDHYFVHRLRGVEKKDGNPLNETRVLCTSLMEHDGVMTADSTITLDPAKSLLGYEYGDSIGLSVDDFALLSKAFLDEILIKYP
ncbi:MAG: hypothetical protein QOG62_1431 [Thermoleophilaceae bacterium]|nr:hypothetical protein [Thermoleophilaceae bacterium]